MKDKYLNTFSWSLCIVLIIGYCLFVTVKCYLDLCLMVFAFYQNTRLTRGRKFR